MPDTPKKGSSQTTAAPFLNFKALCFASIFFRRLAARFRISHGL